jgi:DNA topoisomerase I
MASTPLIVIEAPGKRAVLRRLLEVCGIDAQVFATRGHLLRYPGGLWPLGVAEDFSEPGRVPGAVAARLQAAASGSSEVVVATDPDAEGEVIARDVWRVVRETARVVTRLRLGSLTQAALAEAWPLRGPLSPESAREGDARRVVDRLIGHAFSQAGLPVGRVMTAALGAAVRDEPVIGHLTLVLPAADGGRPYRAVVPVTPSTEALWAARLQTWEADAGTRTALPESVVTRRGPMAAAGLTYAQALLADVGAQA